MRVKCEAAFSEKGGRGVGVTGVKKGVREKVKDWGDWGGGGQGRPRKKLLGKWVGDGGQVSEKIGAVIRI